MKVRTNHAFYGWQHPSVDSAVGGSELAWRERNGERLGLDGKPINPERES